MPQWNWNGILLMAIAAFVLIVAIIMSVSQHRKRKARQEFLAQQLNREQQNFFQDDGIVSPVRIINTDGNTPVEEPEDFETAVSSTIYPSVISLFIHAKKDQFFYGYELLQSLLNHNFVHGAMGFFHNNNGQKTLFSVASIDPPGTFDLDKMGQFKTSGLCLFMQPQRFSNPAPTFDQMIEFAEKIADDLGGIVEDEQHHLLTEQRANYWRSLLVQDVLHDAS